MMHLWLFSIPDSCSSVPLPFVRNRLFPGLLTFKVLYKIEELASCRIFMVWSTSSVVPDIITSSSPSLPSICDEDRMTLLNGIHRGSHVLKQEAPLSRSQL